jgi:hypothetical protein
MFRYLRPENNFLQLEVCREYWFPCIFNMSYIVEVERELMQIISFLSFEYSLICLVSCSLPEQVFQTIAYIDG